MQKLNTLQMVGVGALIIVVLGGALLILSGEVSPPPQGNTSQEVPSQVATTPVPQQPKKVIGGKVTKVNIQANSLEILQPSEQQQYVVRIGEGTGLVRLVFPFDLTNIPPGQTFSPERQPITLPNFKAGDNVFIRSSHDIVAGQDIVDPLEIQALP